MKFAWFLIHLNIVLIQIKDGKIVPEAFKAMKDKPMADAANECQKITAPSRCEVAAKLAECFHKSMEAHKNGAPKP